MSESAPAAVAPAIGWYDHPTSNPAPAEARAVAPTAPTLGWYDHPTFKAAPVTTPIEPTAEEKQLATFHDGEAPAKAIAAVEATFEVPEEVKQLRVANWTDPALAYNDALTVDDIKDPEGAEPMTPETRQAVVNEWRRIAGDVGLNNGELREAVALSKEITATPPDDATLTAWQTENTQHLLAVGGDPESAQRELDAARALVARDPRLWQFLQTTGLGNHPKIVRLVVEKARSESTRGRLVRKPKE
jgi:predicted Zn-dependent protease